MRLAPPQVGSLVALCGGLAFVLVNAAAVGGAGAAAVRLAGLAAAVLVLVRVLRSRPSTAPPPRPRPLAFAGVTALEVLAVALGVRLVASLGHPEAGVAVVALVVGLHFLPLARVLAVPGLVQLGVGMALLGASGLVLAWDGAGAGPVALVAGVGSGALLLLAAWRGERMAEPLGGRQPASAAGGRQPASAAGGPQPASAASAASAASDSDAT